MAAPAAGAGTMEFSMTESEVSADEDHVVEDRASAKLQQPASRERRATKRRVRHGKKNIEAPAAAMKEETDVHTDVHGLTELVHKYGGTLDSIMENSVSRLFVKVTLPGKRRQRFEKTIGTQFDRAVVAAASGGADRNTVTLTISIPRH